MYMDLLSHTLHHRSPPSRSSPDVVAVLSPVSFPGPPVSSPVSSPPDSAATCRFSSRPHHLFNVFLKVRHRKISQCSPNKVCGCRFEYTAYSRNFEKSLHLTHTLLARCPNAKLLHKNSLYFMEKIIFQLLSCLYLYDSGIPVPVHIRKQSQYTDFWRLALTYHAAGIPTSGTWR